MTAETVPEDLQRALDLVTELQESIQNAPPWHFRYKAPVLDQHTQNEDAWLSDRARGINKFAESVEMARGRILADIERGVIPREDPLPSVESLMTTWKVVLDSTGPIAGVRTMIKATRGGGHGCAQITPRMGKEERQEARDRQGRGLGKGMGKGKGEKEGFVDVVARGGEEWVRIYSKKVSSLMAELRELDSMINSDWSDSGSESEDHGDNVKTKARAASTSTSKQNGVSSHLDATQVVCQSLIDSIDSLRALAEISDKPPGAPIPKITLRVTRITPQEVEERDERIAKTFEVIRSKGVAVVFGDLSEIPLSSLPAGNPSSRHETALGPSRRICLDPTALMALCSDLLHYPLPATRSEALDRFFRPSQALCDVPGGAKANGPGRDGEGAREDTSIASNDETGCEASEGDAAADQAEASRWQGQSQNSRELVKNVLEEMQSPLVEEIRDTLEAMMREEEKHTTGDVEWWTTKEAVVYLTEALGSDVPVGEGMEQRRMRRMIGSEEGDFWEGSRYEGKEGVLRGFRVRVFGGDDDDDDDNPPRVDNDAPARTPPTSFHCSLANVAKSCISDYNANATRPTPASHKALPNFLKPQRIPIPKVAQLSLPFPIVSLITLEKGAREGMTTLMFGNVLLRDLFGQSRWKVHGWCQGSYDLPGCSMALNGDGDVGDDGDVEGDASVQAAVWMLPYRSLGEGKRVKFAQGDFSYPNR